MSEETTEESLDNADKIIKKHVYGAMAVGLIPFPFMDFVGVVGVQLNLLRKLAKEYDIPFSKDMTKNLIGSLIGSGLPVSLGAEMGWSLAKFIPGLGYILGAVSTSVVSGACTYAVGKVFKRHFSEGGTFLSFDPGEAREFYAEMFKEGEKVAAKIKTKNEKK